MSIIGFIGLGNIAKAIVGGAVGSNCIKGEDLRCFDIDTAKAAPFTELGAKVCGSAKELASEVDILFLTVKPQVLPTVLSEIAPHLSTKTLIVSPVAGVRTQKIEAMLGANFRIIRVMPNTPLLYGEGATALCKNEVVTDEEFAFVTKMFAACGVTAALPEEQFDAVTGASGSAPAFFLRFANAIIEQGIMSGMNPEDAKKLILKTMAGSAKMAMESPEPISELIRAVASPGGTTEAGLNHMTDKEFDLLTKEVIDSAIRRSKELAE